MRTWQELQNQGYGPDVEYEPGSPHLTHVQLRNQLANEIRASVGRSFTNRGGCRVLEIGAGHGSFTEVAAAAGAEVTVTEMSKASAQLLETRFEHNARVHVIYDESGVGVFDAQDQYDLVMCISVLHHIPDYLTWVERLVQLVAPGGDFLSYQDPLWNPRRRRASVAAQWAAYFAWRLGQGDFKRGLATRWRRLRGFYDEDAESDMVEYHAVRQGVDELALQVLLQGAFSTASIRTYWSTQSSVLQRLGERMGLRSTFGVLAMQKRLGVEPPRKS